MFIVQDGRLFVIGYVWIKMRMQVIMHKYKHAFIEISPNKKIADKQFTTINKKAYPIIQHKADGVLDTALDLINSSQAPFNAIFFDLPGTVNTPGILRALAGMHHIFTPITADRVVMESTLVF